MLNIVLTNENTYIFLPNRNSNLSPITLSSFNELNIIGEHVKINTILLSFITNNKINPNKKYKNNPKNLAINIAKHLTIHFLSTIKLDKKVMPEKNPFNSVIMINKSTDTGK